jgi:nucleotide-binding universal stress UspA family protein
MEALKTAPRLSLANILFTTDFSATSERALRFAMAIANWYGSKLLIVHAVKPEPRYAVPLDRLPLELDPAWQEAQQNLKRFEAAHAFKDIVHETVLEHGEPWSVVSSILDNQKVDLLVLGTHGRLGLKKMVLGSEAEVMFRQSACPVLTLGPHVVPIDAHNWKPKNIIFPTEFSETSLRALPFALSLAEESEANLILLHLTAMVPLDARDDLEQKILSQLTGLLPQGAADWCKPECILLYEFPAEGILRLAQERSADLIVMGVRKGTAAASHQPWATATEVVSRAPCPVLTVRG